MKNMQVIDGAENATFPIYAVDDEDFDRIFPNGEDVEFVKALYRRLGSSAASELLHRIWSNPVNRRDVIGIQGTMFFGLENRMKYFPTKKMSEMVATLD